MLKPTTALAALCCLALALLGASSSASAAEGCPNGAIRETQGISREAGAFSFLPECRGWERVSPANKNGNEVVTPEFAGVKELPFRAASEGGAFLYSIVAAAPGSESGSRETEYLGESFAPGLPWFTLDLAPTTRFSGVIPSDGSHRAGGFIYVEPSLFCGVESTRAPQPKQPGDAEPLPLPAGETAEEGVENLYRWTAGEDGETYELVTTARPVNPGDKLEPVYVVEGASEGCQHIIYEAEDPGYALAGAPETSLYEMAPGYKEPKVASVLPDGHDAQEAINASGGNGSHGQSVYNKISSDGSRVFFTAISDGGTAAEKEERGDQEIYVRSDGVSTTEISAVQHGEHAGSAALDSGALFQGATADGGHVFFTANYGLTDESSKGAEASTICNVQPTSSARGSGCDLYEYNIADEKLHDLSVDVEGSTSTDRKGANVLGVAAISEDGSYVYFSASGQLVHEQGNTEAYDEIEQNAEFSCRGLEEAQKIACEKSNQEQRAAELAECNTLTGYDSEQSRCLQALKELEQGFARCIASPETEQTCLEELQRQAKRKEANLYVEHNGQLRYVSTIRASEGGANGEGPQEQLDALAGEHGPQNLVARVSPDGERLLFGTRESPTGYDNVDASSNERDPELYEYDYTSGSTQCVSCTSSGRPTAAASDPFSADGPFVQVLFGATPRNLSEEGTVFFDSYDPLVSSGLHGNPVTPTVHAYEWRPDGVGGCTSASGCVSLLDSGEDASPTYFEDASESGEDVYITTLAQLAPQDEDGSRDVYDVRVGGGITPPSASESCTAGGCQSPGAGLGSFNHSSESAGSGNPAPPSASSSPGNGVKAFNAHSVTVARKVRGTSVVVSVSAPQAGRIAISAKGIKGVKKTVGKAGVYRLKVVLTARERKLLVHKHRLTITLHVAFAPTSGRPSSANVTVKFI